MNLDAQMDIIKLFINWYYSGNMPYFNSVDALELLRLPD